jgi:legumain
MFNGLLPSDINIYATTAADPIQSSYACYWDDSVQAYIADCYSINWMENTEQANVDKETLEVQFEDVANETNTSIVCQYGQTSIASEYLSAFFEENKKSAVPLGVQGDLSQPRRAVNQRDVDMTVLTNKLREAKDPNIRGEIKKKLLEIKQKRAIEDKLFHQLGLKLVGPSYISQLGLYSMFEENLITTRSSSQCSASGVTQDFECFKRSLQGVEKACGKLDHYGLKYTQQLVQNK